jgi:hypothetical protein
MSVPLMRVNFTNNNGKDEESAPWVYSPQSDNYSYNIDNNHPYNGEA